MMLEYIRERRRGPRLEKALAKYSKHERDRTKDFIHKLTTFFITREFEGCVHRSEDLRKNGMLNGSNEHDRNILKRRLKDDHNIHKLQI